MFVCFGEYDYFKTALADFWINHKLSTEGNPFTGTSNWNIVSSVVIQVESHTLWIIENYKI